ncbi:MAG: disulfide bond formation protein B [Metallibacterium sp.]
MRTGLNPLQWSFRARFGLGFVLCVVLLAYALYVQFILQVQPCPLCILQRIAFMVMGVVFLLGTLHAPRTRGRWIYTLLVTVAAVLGAGVAARHLWLQMQPPNPFGSCGAPLNYMIDNLPLAEVIRKVFIGSGDCAVVDWRFLGMPMPFWTLLWYVLLGAWALLAVRARK